MSDRQQLNGCDYLMLGFDYELRRAGFPGNLCQIVLELAAPVCPLTLQSRLDQLSQEYHCLAARPAGLIRPQWVLPRGSLALPPVRVHCFEPSLPQKLFNEPLAVKHGELVRFDLIEREEGRTTVLFKWAHALMDATAAERFVALVGRDDLAFRPPQMAATSPSRSKLSQRCKLAWKSLHRLDEICQTAPRSLPSRYSEAPACLHYRVESFSPQETQRVRENSQRLCGFLGEAHYQVAAAVIELHQLHVRLDSPSPSYVVPVPVGLRPKGSEELVFGNQVAMLMLQFLPEHVESVAAAAAAAKAQTEHAMREGLLESARMLGEMFHFLPLGLYMRFVKHGLRGEICSLFFGNTGAVNPLLTNFLGATVEDFSHVAAVTPRPGVGVIFYRFRDALRLTVVYSRQVLADCEAGDFAASLRARLLNP